MGLLLCYLHQGAPITPGPQERRGFQRHSQNSGLHSPMDMQGLQVSHQQANRHQHEPQHCPAQDQCSSCFQWE